MSKKTLHIFWCGSLGHPEHTKWNFYLISSRGDVRGVNDLNGYNIEKKSLNVHPLTSSHSLSYFIYLRPSSFEKIYAQNDGKRREMCVCVCVCVLPS
jgi:hypothetical protein